MPMITLKLSHPAADQLVQEAAGLASRLTARWLGKDPEVTAVAVEIVPPQRWFVAGQSLADRRQASFFLEVRITDGTNTVDQKAVYIAEAFAAFRALLGDLNPESYVHVIEARGDGYGYGGKTQTRRYIEAHPLPGPARELSR
jgi:4-oxalocrotonate tautomerase